MILEIARQIADALAGNLSGVAGVNDELDALWSGSLKDSGDTQPSDVNVFDQTRNGPVARGQAPESSLPAVNVKVQSFTAEAAFITENGGPRTGDATVLVWVTFENVDSDEGVEDGSYYLRAVLRSWANYVATQAVWTRNGVTVMAGLGNLEYVEVQAQKEDSHVSGGWLIPVRVRDNSP